MPTYVFVDRQEYDKLKAAVAQLQTPKETGAPKQKPLLPLIFSIVVLVVATVIAINLSDARTAVYSYIVGVVIAQCGIDLYARENKPKWSAAFRLLALALWYMTQLL
ncbi:hypothetical protein [Massilia sp. YIM B02443]|uniref:hypothetical protein n=1 Tax=Massilia sp. YIM B02443 TaxID=3050127 RepID=UPI0025B68F48|nr:hypothetical protein [Massilia sp. YIM B02443]MDN4040240.1 hypothetical protein [Massilia sp. YIM B02443]